MPEAAPLGDVSVLELAGELTGYAGRLLADLGAAVTRVRLAQDSGLPDPFLDAGKTDRVVDRAQLGELVATGDVVVRSGGADVVGLPGLDREPDSRAIHVVLTPFGLDGPAASFHSTDLVRLAAGGLLWLGGYPDCEPVAPYGGQSGLATSIFGVVPLLLALIERDRTGLGCTIEVSAQEVMTQALETALPEYELTGTVRRRVGDAPREAGTGIYPCADGYVSMVAGRLGTAEAWRRLREWLVETGTEGAQELWEPAWEELPFRQLPASVARFWTIFCAFAASRTKAELYGEAQRRSIALAPVNTPAEVLADPQLASRGFFHDGRPSPPYRFSALRGPAPLLAPDPAPAP